VDLESQGLALSTILAHVSAIKNHCAFKAIPITFNTDRFQMMIKGIKKRRAPRKETAKLSKKQLRVLLRKANNLFSGEELCMYKALLSLAFYGFLRPSEYCNDSPHCIQKGSILISNNHLSVKFRSYKHSKGEKKIRVQTTGDDTCPVAFFRAYTGTNLYTGKPGALFNVTGSEWRRQFRRWCSVASIDSSLTPHSLRHGGATWASRMGWSDHRIQQHGRWASNAFKIYTS